jgi:hypothetical protein
MSILNTCTVFFHRVEKEGEGKIAMLNSDFAVRLISTRIRAGRKSFH